MSIPQRDLSSRRVLTLTHTTSGTLSLRPATGGSAPAPSAASPRRRFDLWRSPCALGRFLEHIFIHIYGARATVSKFVLCVCVCVCFLFLLLNPVVKMRRFLPPRPIPRMVPHHFDLACVAADGVYNRLRARPA